MIDRRMLVDLQFVRRLPPYHADVRERLVKSPKVHVRDSGLVHTLLGLDHRSPGRLSNRHWTGTQR